MSRYWDRPISVTVRMIWLVVVSWVVVAVACAAGFVVLRQNFQEDCLRRQESRAAVRVVFETVKGLVNITGRPVDYSRVPGYADLDESFQQFLVNIQTASVGASDFRVAATEQLDRALADLPPLTC